MRAYPLYYRSNGLLLNSLQFNSTDNPQQIIIIKIGFRAAIRNYKSAIWEHNQAYY